MKKNGRHLKIAVVLLLVAVMLVSIFATAAFATDESEDSADVEKYDKPWYTLIYTKATDTEKAKVDIRIKTEFSELKNLTEEDLTELKDELVSVIYHLAFDSILGGQIEAKNDKAVPMLLSAGLPDDLPTEIPDGIDISNVDIELLENFINEQLQGEDAKEKLDAVLSGDYDTIIKLAVDKYIVNSGYTYEQVEAKVNQVITDTIDTIYQAEPEVAEVKKAAATQKVTDIVVEVEEVHEKGESIRLSVSDLATIDELVINGKTVFADDYFKTDVLKELVSELPKPSEIKDFDDAEMVLDYDISAHFVFGTVSLNFSIGFDGDCTQIRKVMGIVADYVEYGSDANGYFIRINVPEKFADMLLRAINGKSVSPETKLKVFAHLSDNGGDVEALINDLSFDEIIELLEEIDFNDILTSDFVSQYVDLSHLSNDEIIAKVKEYESYFNKAKDLVARAMNKLPESLMSKTLFDLYEGDGKFYKKGSVTVDVEEAISAISSKYGALIASFMDNPEITVKGSFEINFEKINRVTYMIGKNVHADGFLPAGADIAFFANTSDVSKWVDANDVPYTEMPDRDIVLYAYNSLSVSVSDGVTAVYASDKSYTLEVTPVYITADPNPTFTYQWYKDGQVIDGATASTLTVSSVLDSGTYYCVVTAKDSITEKTVQSADISVSITKATFDMSGITFEDKTVTFDNDTHSIVIGGTLPAGLNVSYSGEGKNVGTYTITATFTPDDADNYETPVAMTATLTIEKATFDMSGITFEDKTVTFDNDTHSIVIGGTLPAGLNVSYSGEGKTVGTYTITATFTAPDADNYEVPLPMTAILTIEKAEISLSGVAWSYSGTPFVYNKGAHSVVLINVPNGVTVTYVDNEKTAAGTYTASFTYVYDDVNYKLVDDPALTDLQWEIKKAEISFAGMKWVYDEINNPFTYNGTEFTVVIEGAPAGFVITGYENNAYTNAGTYTANYTYEFEWDNDNYVYEGAPVGKLTWKIDKASYNMSGVSFKDKTVKYDGNAHGITVEGTLPDGIAVKYSESKSAVGTYTMTATFENSNPNYNTPDAMTATLTITAADMPTPPPVTEDNFDFKDENGNTIVDIEVEGGLDDGVQLGVVDKTNEYKDIDLSGVLDEGKIGSIGVAYDINFSKDGLGINVDGKKFTTRLMIPESLRSHTNLIVIHISDSGEITVMESTRDGDYMVFETNHFSIYAVVSLDDAPAAESNNWWIWLLLSIILVLAIAVILLIVFRKPGGSDSSETDGNEPMDGSDDETDDELIAEEERADVDDAVIVEEAPAEETPVAEESAPAEEAPAEEAAVAEESAPAEEAPAEETPVAEESAPAEEAPAEEAAVAEESAPAEEAPAEETPVAEESAPVEEVPAEEAVVAEESAPVEEAPAEETPVAEESAPVEEVPAEEAVVAEESAPAVFAPVIIANDDDSIVVNGEVILVHYRSSFTSRLIQSEASIQDYYTAIKNHILSYKGIKARTSWNYEAFNKGRTQCVKLNIKGKSLTLNLALDPKQYNINKYHFTDLSDNPKYDKLPMLMKVRSDRSLKYALELIDEVMKALGIPQSEVPSVDYHMPYETNASLAQRGLVKLILPAGVKLNNDSVLREANVGELIVEGASAGSEVFLPEEDTTAVPEIQVEESVSEELSVEENAVEEASVEEAPAVEETPAVEEAPAVEETPAEQTPAEQTPVVEEATPVAPETIIPTIIGDDDKLIIDGNVILIRYRSSFESRLIQSDADIQDYYTTLKNYLLSFKGIKARMSWNYENFNKGRIQCARLNIKGKTLTINLALTPEAYNVNKYHFTDLSDDPKFDKLPMLLKIRSARALKYALELIDELMKSMEIAQGNIPEVDYHQSYEPNRVLAQRGLMKIILPTGVKMDSTLILREQNVDSIFNKNSGATEAPVVEEVAPVEEAPVVEEVAPVEETPVAEEVAPVEETPVAEEVAPVEETPVAEEVAPVEEAYLFADIREADSIVTDEIAEHSIEEIHVSEKRSGKMCEINIDVICENFENGDVVTLEALQKKRLVSAKAGRVKILAHGRMTKSLTVIADKFSLQAVKMITLAGGTAKKYD